MDVDALLAEFRADPHYAGQIVTSHRLPGRRAKTAPLEPPLPPVLGEALAAQGVRELYSHQVEAIGHIRAGRDVVIVTGTASGKTLCYNLPIVERILTDRHARALYLFPLKALAHDQLGKLTALGLWEKLRVAAYDGDTPEPDRRVVRNAAHIVLTNPDMLHLGILPSHGLWSEFFAHLRYVVIDELHMYRGVFGSHAAHVFRRLARLCERYRSNPTWIACSATIANPAEHFATLTGRPEPVVVDRSGAPSGARELVVWNPPVSRDTGLRRSTNIEATWVLQRLVDHGVRTLAFTLSRQEAELILRYLRAALEASGGGTDRVAAYRAGYLAGDRRAIEQRLASGELTAVISTVALEAGIDIGGLDAAVLVGYPGTVAGFWQQVGRAGRGRRDSLALLLTRNSVVDQFFAAHPETLWSRPTEQALIDPHNVYILGGHLLCAAYEQPLSEVDLERFGGDSALLLPLFEEDGYLAQREGQWYYRSPVYPAASISLRSVECEPYHLTDTASNEVLGFEDTSRLWQTCYPGAIHLHAGEQYRAVAVVPSERRVLLEPVSVDYFTAPDVDVEVRIDEQTSDRPLGALRAHFGDLTVTLRTVGYRLYKPMTFELLDQRPLDCPPRSIETCGLWLTLSADLRAFLVDHGGDLQAGLHAAEHALAMVLPLVAMCDPRDVEGASTGWHPQLGEPALFLYDVYPGGIGLAERGFEQLTELVGRSLELVAQCPCSSGCPGCVQSPFCGSGNRSLDKLLGLVVLRAAAGLDYREEPSAGS